MAGNAPNLSAVICDDCGKTTNLWWVNADGKCRCYRCEQARIANPPVTDADLLAAALTVTQMLDNGWRPYNGWWWWTGTDRPRSGEGRKITPGEAAWLKQARETET